MSKVTLIWVLVALGLAGFISVAGRSKPPPPDSDTARFSFLASQRYSCGGHTWEVKEFLHEQTGLRFVLIPGGVFQSPGLDADDQKAATYVSAFLMCKTEVTQQAWGAVMGVNISKNKGENLPVDSVSWVQAKDFCARTGLALPSELEWEYACRAGSQTRYHWGDEIDPEFCWLEDNAVERTRPVATKLPNAFGLHDMTGNVYEWCESWYHEEGMSLSPEGDALQEGEKALRVLRGGSAASSTCCATSSSRSGNWPQKATPYDGFRPVAYLDSIKLDVE